MDLASLLNAFVLGVVEGLTEFLPVSSTGHLIIVSDLLGLNDEKSKVFDIVIQLGAILAVCWEYRTRFVKAFSGLGGDPVQQRFARNIFVAFMPAAIVGLAFASQIKAYLFNPISVSSALVVGAIAIFWVERWHAGRGPSRVQSVDDMTVADAVKIGLAQCLSLVPGTSRSGATIIGGMIFGLSRQAATEFSFFLAVPILFAATGYQVIKYRQLFLASDVAYFLVGLAISFVAALVAVRGLIRFVATHDFRLFAWYRLILGSVVLAYFA